MLPREDRTHLSGVYQIRCIPTGKIYVGSAKCFHKRWNGHRRDFATGKHHGKRMLRAWNKYGPDAFVFEILEFVEDEADLIPKEQEWLDRLQPYRRSAGYNSSPTAGSQFGFRHSDETKAKMSVAHKGHIKSAETRAKLREARRHLTPESRVKMGVAKKGRPRTAEVRARIAEGTKKAMARPEVRAKTVGANIGRKHSAQSRANMGLSRIGNQNARRKPLGGQASFGFMGAEDIGA